MQKPARTGQLHTYAYFDLHAYANHMCAQACSETLAQNAAKQKIEQHLKTINLIT